MKFSLLMKNKLITFLAPIGAAALCLSDTQAAVAMGSTLVDVAAGKPTFGDVAFNSPTSRGNDGISGGTNYTHADYPTSATPYPGGAVNAPNPYWEVDLSGSYNLESVVITDRANCCDPKPAQRLDRHLLRRWR